MGVSSVWTTPVVVATVTRQWGRGEVPESLARLALNRNDAWDARACQAPGVAIWPVRGTIGA